MNEQVDTAEYEFLWKLLANPANPNHSYIFSLQSLVSDFPQSGVLRALLMPNGDKKHLKHAAAYFNPRVLHKLATSPDSLPKVSADQIVFSDGPEMVPADAYFNLPLTEEFVPPVIPDTETAFTPVVDNEVVDYAEREVTEPATYQNVAAPIDESSREAIPAYIDDNAAVDVADFVEEVPSYVADVQEIFTPSSDNYSGTPIEEEPIHEEIAEAPIVEPIENVRNYSDEDKAELLNFSESEQGESLAKQYDAYLTESEAAPTAPVSSYEDTADLYFHQPIDDEVYDEIVSIEDIGLEQLAILNKAANDGEENYFVFEPEIAEPQQTLDDTPAQVQVTESPSIEQPEGEPTLGHVTAELQPVEQEDLHPAVIPANLNAHQDQKHEANKDVSMYHDEKMPYSFMWWLDKTRKEHADIYQPYAKQAAPAAAQPQAQQPLQKEPLDELQKQYYQAIVSTTSFTELDKIAPKAASPAPARKENKIIERFIQEEPQIKHPAGVKLDNENKAKSSSEDKEELVTETLAKIYTEQMLYHKAVLTYKKLMLKYPEKSLYFAGQIEQLENKIN